MFKIILTSLFLPLSLFAWDIAPFVPSCDMMKTAKVTKVTRNLPPIIKNFSSKDASISNAEYYEFILSADIKCAFELDDKGILYSQICPELNNVINYIKNSSSSVSMHTKKYVNLDNQKFKIVMQKTSDLGYIWQVGECSVDSKKYFEHISNQSSVKNLIKNKFLLVAEDNISLTYYANPGFVVKLEKNDGRCKKNKNCDLKILLKKTTILCCFGCRWKVAYGRIYLVNCYFCWS